MGGEGEKTRTAGKEWNRSFCFSRIFTAAIHRAARFCSTYCGSALSTFYNSENPRDGTSVHG